MPLGNAAKAERRLIVWCRACGHQVEPDPGQLAERHGADTVVLHWRERLVSSPLRQPAGRYGGERNHAALRLGRG
jgi:hypothetical protein